MTTMALPTERKVMSPEDFFTGIDKVLEKRLGTPQVIPTGAPAATMEAPAWLRDLSAWGQKVSPGASWDYIQKRPSGEYAFLRQGDILKNQWTVELREGFLAPIERSLNSAFPMVPLGSIAFGTTLGIVAGEVIDGLVAPRTAIGTINMANLATKLILGGIIVTLGKSIMTPVGALFAVGILGGQVLADILPLDKWVDWILGLFQKKTTTAGQVYQPVQSSSNSYRQATPMDSNARHDRLAHTF